MGSKNGKSHNSKYIKERVQAARETDDPNSNTEQEKPPVSPAVPDQVKPFVAVSNKLTYTEARRRDAAKAEIERRRSIFENAFKKAQEKAKSTKTE